jgi:transposase
MTEETFYEDLLAIPNLRIDSIEKKERQLNFNCTIESSIEKCPSCLKNRSLVNQYDTRKVQDLRISGKEVWLHLRIPQFFCSDCSRYFTQKLDWIEPGKSYTKRQSKWIFELCSKQPFTEVAAIVNLSHKTIERLFYDLAKKAINLPKRYAQVRKLGIDEISNRKGKQDYVCVLTDLERGIQLDILPNRKKQTLLAHFQALGEDFCNQIEVVSCDIWKTYINVSKECFSNAEIVIDRFHVVKAINEVLDKHRKKLRREYKELDCFKSIKWALFKRPEKCNKEQLNALQNAFKKSWLLEEIYQLRNTFNSMFDIGQNKNVLCKELDYWISHAKTIRSEFLNKFIGTLQRWKNPIAAFATTRITNAATEGLNNYLRYFKRISFGLPKFEHMRLRILLATI